MTDPILEDDRDLEAVLEQARQELTPEELSVALARAEDEGFAAGGREVRHWLYALLMGASLVAAVLVDARFLIGAGLLVVLYALPYVVAAFSSASRERTRESLLAALERKRRERELAR